MIAYIEECTGYSVSFKPLNPTGRWKIVSGPYHENKLFIEHKGLIFKSWIAEDNIVFKCERKSIVFECGVV